MQRWFWFAFLICALDCFSGFWLGIFYTGYDNCRMLLSTLGSESSPVKVFYQIWMFVVGISLLVIGWHLYSVYYEGHKISSVLLFAIIVIYAVFDCLVSSIFPMGDTKEMITFSQKVHGYGSAIGSTMFVLLGIIAAIMIWRKHHVMGGVLVLDFLLAVVSFVLFVRCNNGMVNSGVLSYEGLWQRVSYVFMYIPVIVLSRTY